MANFENTIEHLALPIGLDTASLQNFTENLDDRQLLWLSGYFHGLSVAKHSMKFPSQNGQSGFPAVEQTINFNHLPPQFQATVLFGSQTGNSKKAAQKLAEALKTNGLEVVLADMTEFKPAKLKEEKLFFVIVSTQGEGEPPTAAEDLHRFIFGSRAPKLKADFQFSVLALGDKSYSQFCQTGKEFDEQLEKLGAKRLAPRVDCDADWQDDAERWIENVIHNLPKKLNGQAANFSPFSQNGSAVQFSPFVKNGLAAAPKPLVFDRKNPFEAEIFEKIQLNGRGSTRETWHLEMGLEGSNLKYSPGDVLHVLPTNSERLVSEVLKISKLSPTVSINFGNENLPFGNILLEKLELSTLNRDVLQRYFDFTKNEKLGKILADVKNLPQFFWGRDIADLLTEFPADGLTEEILVKILRKIPSRAYSISSSLAAHPDEVHLTVGAVRYENFGRKKQGVASTFLSDRVQIGEKIKVFIEENEFFKLPKDQSAPIIMVGAGTGIAPFRAFLEERTEQNAAGKNWLFFGNPHFKTDFLYQLEWQQSLKNGNLTHLDVAFSRDQKEKIYVQHKLLKQSRRVFDWLENGANFYVCGDKNRMAGDVEKALVQIAIQESSFSVEKATEYVKDLKKQRRYLEDVY